MSHCPTHNEKPLACVIGDLSMVRALGRSGVPVVATTDDPETSIIRSRYCRSLILTPSWVKNPQGAIDALIEWGKTQQSEPVLFYQGDHDLVALSRNREKLNPYFRFILPPEKLVEDLTDKLKFAELSEKLNLPVPKTLLLRKDSDIAAALTNWDSFPCVVKPSMRANWFQMIGCNQKALRIESRRELDNWLDRLEKTEQDLVVQQSIEGGEENIVSYHAYIRPGGEIVAEFTGRKVRTGPRLYGISSCVEITREKDVRDLGRSIVKSLDFSGILKIDFKQNPDTRQLYMLEINPRFNLWHHPGAVAGVSIPKAVYQDCIEPGSAKPMFSAKSGVRWIDPYTDVMAFKEYHAAGELSVGRWLLEILTTEVNEGFQWSDPLHGVSRLGCKVAKKLSQNILRKPMTANC